jgi:hypothetical protein
LPTNCGLESSIRGYFAIKNQTNPFVPGFGFHRDALGALKKCSSLQDESASARIKNGRLFTMTAKVHFLVIARRIAEINL